MRYRDCFDGELKAHWLKKALAAVRTDLPSFCGHYPTLRTEITAAVAKLAPYEVMIDLNFEPSGEAGSEISKTLWWAGRLRDRKMISQSQLSDISEAAWKKADQKSKTIHIGARYVTAFATS